MNTTRTKMMNAKQKSINLLACLLIGIVMISCTENIDSIVPANGNEAYINFYNAMEVTLQSFPGDSLAIDNYIYINDSVPSDQFKTFPKFSISFSDDGRVYPNSPSGTNLVLDGIGGYGSNAQYWMPIMADTYKFIFTSRRKVFLADTTVTLAPKTYTAQYLTESPASSSAYTIVTTPVEMKGTKGKVRVQVVNLATDWGAIDVFQVDADDNEIASDLPEALPFGGYSSYAELDVNNANSNNKLILKFRKHGDDNVRLTTGLPAISGSSYILVVKGFIEGTTRYVKKNNNDYFAIEITPNLRIDTRRVY